MPRRRTTPPPGRPARDEAGQDAALDLRLVPAALAAWLVAWQARLLPVPGVLVAAGVAAAAALLLLTRGPSTRRNTVAAALLCAAAAAACTAARVEGRTAGPLPALVARGAAVQVRAVLADDPRSVTTTPGRDPLTAATLRVERLTSAGRSYALRVPVLLFTADPGWSGLLPGQAVVAEGRLQPPRRGDDVAAVLSGRGAPRLLGRPSRTQRAAGALRAGLRRAVAVLPPAERGLLPGLVVGDTSGLDPGLREDFRTTGLSHLVAVSGTNVAVLLGAVLLLSRRLGLPLPARAPAGALALLAFVVLVRPSPSVLRAAVMGGVALLALAAGTRRQALPALCTAVLLLVLLDPDLAASPGFALSVLATAGLLLLAPGWQVALARRVPGPLAAAVAVPAAAQTACGPVVVALSGSLGLLSVPANLLAVPAVAPVTVVGVLCALTAPVSLHVAEGLAWLAYLPTAWLVVVARAGARLPGAALPWPDGTSGALLLAGLSVALAVVLVRPRLRRVVAAAACGVLLAALGLSAARPGWPPPGWFLVSCDVGQGDAAVLRVAPGTAVVVDAGPDSAAVDRCLSRLSVDRVPLVLLTHLHADHVDGLPGVLRGRQVGAVEVGPLAEPVAQWAQVQREAREAGVPVVPSVLGAVRSLGPLRWEVLAPDHAYRGSSSDPNNSSVVLRVQHGPVRVLLTGDVEPEAQQDLLARVPDLTADVMKVPHHGSRHQLPAFLDAVHARVVLTSVGADNGYGHPAPETLARLTSHGARSYRTDRDGDSAVTLTDGVLRTAGRRGDGQAPASAVAAAGDGRDRVPRAVVPDGLVPAAAFTGARPAATTAVSPGGDAEEGGAAGAVARAPPPAGPQGRARGLAASRSPRGTRRCRPARGLAWDHEQVPASPLVPLTLVVGDEGLLVDRAVSAVVRAARAADPEVDVRDLEASGLAPGDLDGLLAPSLFGERRVLVLRAVQDLGKDVAAELTAYVADPLPEVSLVAVHAGGAKGKALVASLTSAGARRVEAAKVTKASERRELVRRELRGDGRQVSEEAVGLLLDAVGTDLRELCSAAGQLLADTEGPITDEVVARYYKGRAEASGFAVADRAVEGDLGGALELLRFGQGAGLAHVLVTSALASTLRSLAMVASAGRAPAGALASQLGMPPWKVEKTQRQARGWRPEGLSQALQAVAQADGDVKGGAADAGYALERALLSVVQARGGAR